MERRRLLRGVAIFALLTTVFTVSVAATGASACTLQELRDGDPTCGEIADDQVILTGTQPGAGSGSSGGSGGGGGSGASGTGGIAEAPAAPPCDTIRCARDFTVTTITPTLDDIAAFRPTPEVNHMEPNGWFVVGLDANFYATGGVRIVDGTLLGYPASVRFTPIRWRWQYGDGSSATRSTRGGTWDALGIREFDATPTSHVYERAGTYYIDLTVGYRAEYRWNELGWGAIPGTLWLPSNRLVATVGGAKTVLVERDCTVSPGGPGC